MAATPFSADGTVIPTAWLNDVNTLVWTVFNGATTVALVKTALGLSTPFTVANGGTGLATLTAHALYVGNGTSNPNAVAVGATNQVLHGSTGADPSFSTIVTADLPSNQTLAALVYIIDGGGSVPTTGVKGDLLVPFGCTINSATLQADASGSAVVDIWKKTYTLDSPPTVANTITASALPTLSSHQSAQDATLTGWTTSIAANDMLRFNLNSVTTCTRLTLTLKVTKT